MNILCRGFDLSALRVERSGGTFCTGPDRHPSQRRRPVRHVLNDASRTIGRGRVGSERRLRLHPGTDMQTEDACPDASSGRVSWSGHA
jgi:hypothetical protein